MNIVYSLYHIIRADFLERIRRYGFLFVLGMVVYAGYLCVPPLGASYTAFVIHGRRGFYNSPWVGLVFGVVAALVVTLIGFYLVKGSIKRDYDTRMGQIIAATPLRGPVYIMGKWLSNLAVLGLILSVLTVMAAIMQIVRGEDSHVEILALAAPIWLMGLPTLAAMAGVAVLFESISFLRGGTGSVLYFFVWFGMVMLLSGMMFIHIEDIAPGNDFAGVSRAIVDIRRQMTAEGLDIHRGSTDIFVPTRGRAVVRFAWNGIEWTAKMIFERILWFGIAAMVALSGIFNFDRFDPARRRDRRRKKNRHGYLRGVWRRMMRAIGLSSPNRNISPVSHQYRTTIRLKPLDRSLLHQRFLPVFVSELILMAKSRKWWWHATAAGLFLAVLFPPLEVSHRYLFPIVWLWPVLVWSQMGAREERYQTGRIVFSNARVLRLQLPAMWLAGVVAACITGGSFALRLIFARDYTAFYGWLAGALFIPSLALALGVWSRGTRLFEVVYVLLWFVGPFKGTPEFDFMGVTREAVMQNTPMYYLGLSFLMNWVFEAMKKL